MTNLYVGKQVRIKTNTPEKYFRVHHHYLSEKCTPCQFLGKVVTVSCIDTDGFIRVHIVGNSSQIIVRQEYLENLDSYSVGDYIRSKETGKIYLLIQTFGNRNYLVGDDVIQVLDTNNVTQEIIAHNRVNKVNKEIYDEWVAKQKIYSRTKPKKDETMRPTPPDAFSKLIEEQYKATFSPEKKNWIVAKANGIWYGMYTYENAIKEAKLLSVINPECTYYVSQLKEVIKTTTTTNPYQAS